MAQLQMQMTSQLRQLVFYHLDNESPENAIFVAARLLALDPRNADSAHLLSLSYLRMRRFKTAYDTSQKHANNGRSLGCSHVFALACEALGKHSEGIAALDKVRSLWMGRSNWNKHSDTTRRHIPDAPAVMTLLGRLYRGLGDLRRSGEYLAEAHKANPFVWTAFQGLCEIGAEINVSNSFKMTPEMVAQSHNPVQSQNGTNGVVKDDHAQTAVPTANGGISTPTNDPFAAGHSKAGSDWSFQFPKIKGKGMFGSPPKITAQPSWETPTNGGSVGDDVEMGGLEGDAYSSVSDAPAAPLRKSRTLSRLGLDNTRDTSRLGAPQLRSIGRSQSDTTDGEETSLPANRTAAMHKRTHSGHATATASDAGSAPPRRSNRLFGQLGSSKGTSRPTADPMPSVAVAVKRDADIKKARAAGVKARGTSTVGRVVSGNRKVMPPAPDAKESRAPSRNSVTIAPAPTMKTITQPVVLPDTAAVEELLTLFRQLALGSYAVSKYDCRVAVKAFETIAPTQRDTAWVMAQIGKAYYEAAEYSKAEEFFARMMKLQPSRIEDTDYYSTVLWQLKKPVQLAFLAHTLKEVDFEAPQTWCAAGNAFSLNREHDQAIGCFKRAAQIDHKFHYAWTLIGHELLTNEEYDAALTAYRKGVGSERRGYASWYGLGKCYERMGKLEEAERHYRIAAMINKQNAVLFVCIGVILEKMRHPRDALVQYTHAIQLTPKSALARFRRARVLMALQLYPDALVELSELLQFAPDEANVWYMLGKCHKALGNRGETVRCFTTAMNLDAKAASHIKDALEAIDESEDEEDSEA